LKSSGAQERWDQSALAELSGFSKKVKHSLYVCPESPHI
jgi:hypothetical protein